MCGLTGFLSTTGPFEASENLAILRRMTDSIAHRGPDNDGHWLDDEAGIALGHRRLAVVDLSAAGLQPMSSRSGRYRIVFNGEIYNHLELRARLEREGFSGEWRGHSDTETLLAAIEAWGLVPALQACIGMFALAIWDRELHRLSLARDRFGEKPVYYGWQGHGHQRRLLFASELKALEAHPAFGAEVNRDALALLLRYNCIPAPYCIYTGIHKLPPASILSVERGDETPLISTYWSATDVASDGCLHPLRNIGAAEATDQLEEALKEAVSRQMIADVPLGAFLSGGVDSSVIVALMQAQSPRKVRTFSIGVDNAGYNEAEYAKAVAEHLQTEHTELYVSTRQAMDVIPALPAIYDEPFADSSQIAMFLVSQLARQHVTVALSGDGGDELFAGYNRYTVSSRLWARLESFPAGLRAAAGKLMERFPPSLLNDVGARLPGGRSVAHLGNKLHKGAGVLGSRNIEELHHNLASHWRNPTHVVLNSTDQPTGLSPAPELKGLSAIERMMALDSVTYLPDDILVKGDRAAMANSLEMRMPFLDHKMFELAWRLPIDMKLHQGVGKWILRQVLYRHVPERLIERPKMGFALPLDEWLRGDLRDWAENLLSTERLRQDGYFTTAIVRAKWDEHISGKRNWSHHLWSILMFQAWLDHHRS